MKAKTTSVFRRGQPDLNSTCGLTSTKRFRKGFTLAEVLITLGIIGVIAALILPGIIEDARKRIYAVQLKKAYSVASQAFKKMCADDGGVQFQQTEFARLNSSNGIHSNESHIRDYLKKYFNITKYCMGLECGYHYYDQLKNSKNGNLGYVGMDGNKYEQWAFSTNYAFFTADGMIFFIRRGSFSMQGGWGLHVDVNGLKGPNILGRDLFQLYIRCNCTVGAYYDAKMKETLGSSISDQCITIPVNEQRYGFYWRNYNWVCGDPNIKDANKFTTTSYGYGCAARIMENGWVMDY